MTKEVKMISLRTFFTFLVAFASFSFSLHVATSPRSQGEPHDVVGGDLPVELITHGEDIPPPVEEARIEDPPLPSDCGEDGPRVQALHVREAGTRDEIEDIEGTLLRADHLVYLSALKTSIVPKRIRFVTDTECNISVLRLAVPPGSLSTFSASIVQVIEQGYNDPNRQYILFAETSVLCGIAGIYNDDKPGQDNFNNTRVSYSRVDRQCADSAYVVLHELWHMIGAVQLTAPNSNLSWHCSDNYDVMCYSSALHPCPLLSDRLVLDCNDDDYFHTSPPEGSYLATHWNTANSRYLYDEPLAALIWLPWVARPEGTSESEWSFRID